MTLSRRPKAWARAFQGSPRSRRRRNVDVRWDDAASCLTFEEKDRADAGHTQRGRVYIPDGRSSAW